MAPVVPKEVSTAALPGGPDSSRVRVRDAGRTNLGGPARGRERDEQAADARGSALPAEHDAQPGAPALQDAVGDVSGRGHGVPGRHAPRALQLVHVRASERVSAHRRGQRMLQMRLRLPIVRGRGPRT